MIAWGNWKLYALLAISLWEWRFNLKFFITIKIVEFWVSTDFEKLWSNKKSNEVSSQQLMKAWYTSLNSYFYQNYRLLKRWSFSVHEAFFWGFLTLYKKYGRCYRCTTAWWRCKSTNDFTKTEYRFAFVKYVIQVSLWHQFRER